jgi:nitroreductase
MEFYEAVEKRRTIRDFEDVSIPEDVMERILDAGMKAPSNDHMRDWHFLVIQDKNVLLRLLDQIPEKVSAEEVNAVLRAWDLNDECQQKVYIDAIPKQYQMLMNASCVIIPLFRQKTDILHPANLSHLNGFASIWCCIENIFLAATAEGYACTLRIPLGKEDIRAREVLNFPEDYRMPCFIAVGKPGDQAVHLEQKKYSLRERIHKNSW